MKTVKILTGDRELYAMLALWITDEGFEVTDKDDADLTVWDNENSVGAAPSAVLLSVGDESAELPRPFSRLAFTESLRGKLEQKKTRFRVDQARKRIYHSRNYVILTDKEFAIFGLLNASIDRPVSRDAISAVARGGSQETNAADVYICHLRRKLTELFGENPIRTVRGHGYMLTFSKSV